MKERLDCLLVELGLAPSREKAKALIRAGLVYVDGKCQDKAGSGVEAQTAVIEVRGEACPYVSRGGLKLEKAIACFGLRLEGKICLDIGASTGGFTDCMLQNGAAKVYAVDVGTGQLAQKLKADARVVDLEQTNFRYMGKGGLPEEPDFAGADVSFISLEKILPPAWDLLKEGGGMVCLVKPQFEAGREKVGKKGVVREEKVRIEVLDRVMAFAEGIGFTIAGVDFSPIKGPEGNVEFLLYLVKREGAPLADRTGKAAQAAREAGLFFGQGG